MERRTWLGAIAVASLLMTGCAASAAEAPESPNPGPSHTMPDGTVMSGSEHEAHDARPENEHGPSEAAQMVCAGQVVTAVAGVLGLEAEVSPTSSWEKPMFTCTYEIDGRPLVLSVHDATDEAEGRAHFADLQNSLDDAEEIEGMAGLGMPSFSTGTGIVAFVRDGKTLLVDATALPSGLGANGSKTQSEAAYALASAVLVCWVEHD
ncbi:hypothetical protein ACFWN7_11265 [Agromyces sp. NPDC058484]|uniref:hypothetical protein n=1 Tax=Agromyces sp. NPDC058484 TaxID=3346524 RepID=UPI003669D6EB